MKRGTMLAALLCSVAYAGCQDSALSPDGSAKRTEPQFAKGGIPGPPPTVMIPHNGPPPGVPSRRPPTAGPPSFLSRIIEVGSGGDFSCALRDDGLVYCWGVNNVGQLGDGSQAPSSVPVQVSGAVRFAHIYVGDIAACGLTATGAAYCWGSNQYGLLGAALSDDLSPVPVAVAGGHTFIGLHVGLRTVCGVATDGVTYCWGENGSYGLLGTGTTTPSSDVPVAVQNSGSLGFTQVTVGFFDACALDGTGAAYCWGSSSFFGNGTTGSAIPTPTPAASGATFAAITAGNIYDCGLDGAGAAHCWGQEYSGELGNGSLAATVLSPTPVLGNLTFASLDAQDNNTILGTTCGITTSNQAWCWGADQSGTLGGAAAENCNFSNILYACSSTPVNVSAGHDFAALAIGLHHVCALDTGGAVWCWGNNTYGELGDGTMVDSTTPVQVQGLKG